MEIPPIESVLPQMTVTNVLSGPEASVDLDQSSQKLLLLLDAKEKLRESQRRYRESLGQLRSTVRDLREKLAVKHETKKNLIGDHIAFLQRELGSVNLKEFFSESELVDLTSYVNVNPYLKSMLEKRNPKLFNNLMSYSEVRQ